MNITEEEALAAVGQFAREVLLKLGHSGNMVMIYEVGKGDGHLSTIHNVSLEESKRMAKTVATLEPESSYTCDLSLDEIAAKVTSRD